MKRSGGFAKNSYGLLHLGPTGVSDDAPLKVLELINDAERRLPDEQQRLVMVDRVDRELSIASSAQHVRVPELRCVCRRDHSILTPVLTAVVHDEIPQERQV